MEKLTFEPQAHRALDIIEAGGHEAWLVGGCVRDLLRGAKPKDYDIATSAGVDEVRSLFRGNPTNLVGARFGTARVLLGGEEIDITTYRQDGTYSDMRHPDEVTFAKDLGGDLCRRDFTINAMAYSPKRGLVDLFGGQEDLANGIIRAVGDPNERFSEDALRILRAMRFASRYGYAIEEGTFAAMVRNADRLQNIAAERIKSELDQILLGAGARQTLYACREILFRVLPELEPCDGFDQRNPHHIYDVLVHTLFALEAVRADPVLRWAALLHDIGKPAAFTLDEHGIGHFRGHPRISAAMADEVFARLKFDRRSSQAIRTLIELHDDKLGQSRVSVKRALCALGPEMLSMLIELKVADNLAQNTRDYSRQDEYGDYALTARDILEKGECFSLKALAVTGSDLVDAGASPGPGLGEALNALLARVIAGDVPNEREALIASYRKSIQSD